MRHYSSKKLAAVFDEITPVDADFFSLRYQWKSSDFLAVGSYAEFGPEQSFTEGVLVTFIKKGGIGYAATSDISKPGLKEAVDQARYWAELGRRKFIINFSDIDFKAPVSAKVAVSDFGWTDFSRKEKLDVLVDLHKSMRRKTKIIDVSCLLNYFRVHTHFLSSLGADIIHSYDAISPELTALARSKTDAQRRTYSSGVVRGQNFGENFEKKLLGEGIRIADEAAKLISAPKAPTGNMSLLLGSEQLIFQVHESIGHPLELDRILGDERNFAGSSFVTKKMFGVYQYGSELLNITTGPRDATAIGSYDFDDEASPSQNQSIIENGRLLRGIGGTISGYRSGLGHIAAARSSAWNRPPIDRMANLNMEPGSSSLNEMVSGIENGIFMDTCRSWSIDHNRIKFQFGCELGRLIKDGEFKGYVKNPNYRGETPEFWHSLSAVGDVSTYKSLAIGGCGKGEPGQSVFVGHGAPVARFDQVDVVRGNTSMRAGPNQRRTRQKKRSR